MEGAWFWKAPIGVTYMHALTQGAPSYIETCMKLLVLLLFLLS